MRTKELRDRFGVKLRESGPAPAELPIPISMWNLLIAIERSEHEHIIRTQADALAASQARPKRQ
jgi:hypothetical protein